MLRPPENNSQSVGCIRLLTANLDTADALTAQTLVDGRELPVAAEYPSVEAMIADGWQIDG